MLRKIALCLTLIFLTGNLLHAQAKAEYRHRNDVVLQDPVATPGEIDPALTKQKLCDPSFHTGSVRNVTESEKKEVCAMYGITTGCPGKGYEIDHLISIELGGSNNITNLWPQPRNSDTIVGYETKDVVENRAHRAVCSGKLSLVDAQKGIASDWYQFALNNGFIASKK